MDDHRLGFAVRSLRHARGWRQTDLAARAGVSATSIRLIETGSAERLTVRIVRQVASALGLTLRWDPGPAPALARLRDSDHAALAETLARQLTVNGWEIRPELSYSRYGERGRIDLLAYHRSCGVLLVIEVKTMVVDVQALLGGLDAKVRLAPTLVRDFGWAPRATIPVLVVADGRTNRRRVADHGTLFARFEVRGRAALRWIAAPSTTAGGLLVWVTLPNRNHNDLRRAGRQRVRPRTSSRSVERA